MIVVTAGTWPILFSLCPAPRVSASILAKVQIETWEIPTLSSNPKEVTKRLLLKKKKKSLTQASMGKLILKKNISSLHSILLFYSKLLHLCPIGSLAVSHFYCPALTTVCNHWKKQSFDYIYYTDLCQQSNVSAFYQEFLDIIIFERLSIVRYPFSRGARQLYNSK